MNLYTYLVRNSLMGPAFEGDNDWGDEIDVRADDRNAADYLARLVANDLYGTDSVLELINSGGSGGLFVTF